MQESWDKILDKSFFFRIISNGQFETFLTLNKTKGENFMKDKKVLFLTQAAMIAALYVVLTFIANAFGLANYAVQVRFSEALTILPYFTPAAIPGLFVGCLLSNILTGCALPDIIFGSLATLIGALGTYALRRWKWCAPICPIVANTIIVPLVLLYGYGLTIEGLSDLQCFGYYCLTVGAGEIISCGVLGMILLFTLQKYRSKIFR
jgi:uncharacterized membrane protein